jgi:GT2 family glycosyltransferase
MTDAIDLRGKDREDSIVLSILVVSFNTRHLTLNCLASVAQTVCSAHEVIVVDNASVDGSAEAVAAQFPGARLLALPDNIGFGRAMNLAARQATGKFLLLLNPDTVALEGSIDSLAHHAVANPDAGIWGGRTFFQDGRLNPTSCWRRMTLWSVFCRCFGLSRLVPGSNWLNPEAYPTWHRDTAQHVDIVTGCLLLIKRDLWDSLDGFDPAFFVYGEEVDLCLRAHRCGARPVIVPEAEIIHHEGASQAHGPNKIIQILAARIRNIRLHFPRGQRRLAVHLTRAGAVMRWMALSSAATIRSGSRARRETWRVVMLRRAEWWGGYPEIGKPIDAELDPNVSTWTERTETEVRA